MSARTATTAPGRPPFRIPTTPVFATGWRTSRPAARSRSATSPPVRSSRLPSSGWRWMSRRVSTSRAAIASVRVLISASGAVETTAAARTATITEHLPLGKARIVSRAFGEPGDLVRVQAPPLARPQLAEGEAAHGHAHELLHVVPDRAAHAADLAVPSLGQDDLEPRGPSAGRSEDADLGGTCRLAASDGNALAQHAKRRRFGNARHPRVIRLRDVRFRRGETV